MHSVPGFNLACAEAAKKAMRTDDPTFIARTRKTEFYGLYDPGPVGAVFFEGNVIHVASLRSCGLTVKRLVNEALRHREILFAPVLHRYKAAGNLAVALGFKPGIEHNEGIIYWRLGHVIRR